MEIKNTKSLLFVYTNTFPKFSRYDCHLFFEKLVTMAIEKHIKTRQKMALGERRSRESPCFLIVFKWTKTRNKWLAELSREQKGGILNTTNFSIATVMYSQRVFADISSLYLQPELSWHVKISNQDVRIFCDVRNNYAGAIKQLSQHF